MIPNDPDKMLTTAKTTQEIGRVSRADSDDTSNIHTILRTRARKPRKLKFRSVDNRSSDLTKVGVNLRCSSPKLMYPIRIGMLDSKGGIYIYILHVSLARVQP